MQWTHEQSPIIQSKASKILVRAFAGTGKTTTLVGSKAKLQKSTVPSKGIFD